MDPFLYVEEEYKNVAKALDESLRFDYGPGQTVDYYNECRFRLDGIKEELDRLRRGEGGRTSRVVAQLWDLANRLTLIERSHLGEFSWPFAAAIRDVATKLLSEDEGLRDKVKPIIHMIAEGTSYQILSEKVLDANKQRRLYTVAFPRQLKHHVLMHALFGHELGHATFYSNRPKVELFSGSEPPSKKIISILRREGPLRDCAAAMTWLNSKEAPEGVAGRIRGAAPLTEGNLSHWLVELVCDLFGVMLFGPAFAAAHRTYLEPSCRSAFEIQIEKTSHPAYAIRRNLIIAALDSRGWLQPVATEANPLILKTEEAFISYVGGDRFDEWATVFTPSQIEDALGVIQDHFVTTGTQVAKRPDEETLAALVGRIARHLPPIREEVSELGVSKTFEVRLEEQLYAGWVYWLGGEALGGERLSFLNLNQLCDLALLQQRAIEIASGRKPL